MTASPLIPAATVMVLRDYNGRLEVLMLRRNRQLKSFGGAWVFPGGRVDEVDAPGEGEVERARAAAIRETLEETGLDIEGADMAVLSCWIPPVQEKRRFSTWFFIVRAPDMLVQIDQGEIHDYRWVCPKEFLESVPSPDIMIVPPTYVSLTTLTQFSNVDSVISYIHGAKTDIFETRFAKDDQGFVTLWKADAAYENLDFEAEGPRHRLLCRPDKWEYQRD
ncbi:NUDIX hydrolase [Hellea balneolensis]|uniref:NUDIX hydrolase n=1 Tax=Hellea balneolensis TaxID=287478 RepID=UPI0004208AF3|nr:NUDIX hydrolase [Hellea balneolensis]